MMNLWQKTKLALARFMQGRHGPDNLSMFTLLAGLVLTVLSSVLGFAPLSFAGMVLYILTLFRMLSRNHEARMAENRKYVELTSGWKTRISQFLKRTKNRRDYKYFKCPNCKVLLRLRRGTGEKDITCVRCGYQFKHKA